MEVDQENNNNKKSSSHMRKQCYRDLLNRIEGIQENEDVGINTVKELGVILKEVNVIDDQCPFTDRVEYADETLLEHVVLSTASGILVKCIQNVDMFTSTYDSAEFASKIMNTFKESDEFKSSDWLNILQDARTIVPSLPNYTFLYGSFDPTKLPEPKQRKERGKREAQENVEKVKLQRIHNLQNDDEGVEDTVNFLGNVLTTEFEKNDNKPISYFNFVIDSDDYGTTIENIFYTSFLIRDSKAKLDVENHIPTIQPMRKRDLKKFRNDGGTNTQMITLLTMDDWEALREKSGYIQSHKKLLKSKT